MYEWSHADESSPMYMENYFFRRLLANYFFEGAF